MPEETEDDWLLNYIDADSVPPARPPARRRGRRAALRRRPEHERRRQPARHLAGLMARDGPHVLGWHALPASECPRPPPLLGARQGALLPRSRPDRAGQLQPLGDDRGSRGRHAPVGERKPPGHDREPADRRGAAHARPRAHPAQALDLRLLPVARRVPSADGDAPPRPHPGVDELPALPVADGEPARRADRHLGAVGLVRGHQPTAGLADPARDLDDRPLLRQHVDHLRVDLEAHRDSCSSAAATGSTTCCAPRCR